MGFVADVHRGESVRDGYVTSSGVSFSSDISLRWNALPKSHICTRTGHGLLGGAFPLSRPQAWDKQIVHIKDTQQVFDRPNALEQEKEAYSDFPVIK